MLKKKKLNILSIVNIILLIIVIYLGFFIIRIEFTHKKEMPLQNKEVVELPAPIKTKNTKLLFVGDLMLDRGVESSVEKNFNGDFNLLFFHLPELREADISFANLEGPVSLLGNNVGSKYSFHTNPKVLDAIVNAGFDIVSFANNHVGDWNLKAFTNTLENLSDKNILQTGAGKSKGEVIKPTVIIKNNIKFGFLGVSDVGPNWMEAKENSAGILLAKDPNLGLIIEDAKKECDVLIVSFHWGEEYKKVHNKRQEYLAKLAIDSGADVIIGHHPHVIEDIGEYKNKPIVYSLGNFIFDQYFSEDTMQGMIYEIEFKDKDIFKTEAKIIKLNKKYQPEGIFEKI